MNKEELLEAIKNLPDKTIVNLNITVGSQEATASIDEITLYQQGPVDRAYLCGSSLNLADIG